MEKGRTLADYARSSGADVEAAVKSMLEAAYKAAEEYGRVVGRVSRYSEVRVGESPSVEFELDPDVYYGEREAPFHRIGDYLAVVDPKTGKLILVRVRSIVRRDELAWLKVEPPMSGYSGKPDPRGLLTRTTVHGELVVEADPKSWRVAPAVTSVEPQSPVIDPRPDVLERLMDLPRKGVPLGALATPGGLVKGGKVAVRLPLEAFYQHILVIGTTGSGKTTLLKNMIASIYSLPSHPIVVVADMNQDFIQLPVPARKPPAGSEEELVRATVYQGVREPSSLSIVVPFTDSDYRDALDSGAYSIEGIVASAIKRYVEESILPLIEEPVEVKVKPVRSGVGGTSYFMAHIEGLPFKLTVYAYAISTPHMPTDDLLGLMPGLTQHARDLLRRLRKMVSRVLDDAGPLQALYAAVGAYLDHARRRGRRDEGGDGDDDVIRDALEPYIVYSVGRPGEFSLEDIYLNVEVKGLAHKLYEYVEEYKAALYRARPHLHTLEALYRRLASLLDSGIVDIIVAVPGRREAWIVGEPPWRDVVSRASESGSPVVLDLKWASERGTSSIEGPRLAAYRMLGSLIAWKHRAWASRGREKAPNILVFIDEAHQFFPQEKGSVEEKEASRQVAAMISTMARLGRARGVGLVFSTHSPKDLHDIVVQLANTKIVLRTERWVAEHIDVPQEVREYLPRLPDRRMLILSHVFKEGYVMAHTTTPLTGHYDIPSSSRPPQGV